MLKEQKMTGGHRTSYKHITLTSRDGQPRQQWIKQYQNPT